MREWVGRLLSAGKFARLQSIRLVCVLASCRNPEKIFYQVMQKRQKATEGKGRPPTAMPYSWYATPSTLPPSPTIVKNVTF